MFDLVTVIIQWLAGLRPGDERVARRSGSASLVQAVSCLLADVASKARLPHGLGWITMRLDPVPCVRGLPVDASARRHAARGTYA